MSVYYERSEVRSHYNNSNYTVVRVFVQQPDDKVKVVKKFSLIEYCIATVYLIYAVTL